MLFAAAFFFISIHALREEGDIRPSTAMQTPPYFYPRPPRGGRLFAHKSFKVFPEFLSTPSARRATLLAQICEDRIVFLSTPSARRATNCVMGYITIFTISIHALREEGDLS